MRYIYSTFPIVEREEMAAQGRYRSCDLCLAYMSALAPGPTRKFGCSSMARGHAPVSLLSQAPGGSVYLFLERINTLLRASGLKRFRAAVAYARWDGLGLIAPHIEELLKSGGEFQTIYGVGNGVTTPDSLLYNLYLQELYSMHTYAGAIEDEYSNATFHPKFFEFKFLDRTVAILGSANLTGGGLTRNTELGFEVESGRATRIESDLDQIWNSMRAGAQQVSLELIRKLSLGSEHDHTKVSPESPASPHSKQA